MMKGKLMVKTENGEESMYCVVQSGCFHFGTDEEDATKGIAYRVEKFTVADPKTFTLQLRFEESEMELKLSAATIAEGSKWSKALNAIKPNEPASKSSRRTETSPKSRSRADSSPRRSEKSSEETKEGGSNLMFYAKIGGALAVGLYFVSGSLFSSSPYPYPYGDPAYHARYGGGGAYGMYPPPYGAMDPYASGPFLGFFWSFAIFSTGLGLIIAGFLWKRRGEGDMVNEWRDPADYAAKIQAENILEAEFGEGPLGFALVNNSHGVVIASVTKGQSAESLGIQPGYKLTKVNSEDVSSSQKWEDVVNIIGKNPRPVTITFQKNPNQSGESSAVAPDDLNEEYDKEVEERETTRGRGFKLMGLGAAVSLLGLLFLYLWFTTPDPMYLHGHHMPYMYGVGVNAAPAGSSFTDIIVLLLLFLLVFILLGLLALMIYLQFFHGKLGSPQPVSASAVAGTSASSSSSASSSFYAAATRMIFKSEPEPPRKPGFVDALIREKNQAIANVKTISVASPAEPNKITAIPKEVVTLPVRTVPPTIVASASTVKTSSTPAAKPEATTAAPTKKYPLEKLAEKDFAKSEGLKMDSLENYLSDAEFATAFKMSRADFGNLSKWKRDELKRSVGLF